MTDIWILEQLVKVTSVVFGALIIVWQIGKQFKNSLKLQREAKIDELRLELYKEIGTIIENASQALTKAMIGFAYSIPNSFRSRQSLIETFKEFGFIVTPDPIKMRGEDISKLHFDAEDKAQQVFDVMEKYEIVFLELYNELRSKLFNASRELADSHTKYFNQILPYLPVDVPKEKQEELKATTLNKKLPSEESLKEIDALGNVYLKKAMDLQCILFDLRVEAQNMLLSHMLDGKKVSKRTVGVLAEKQSPK